MSLEVKICGVNAPEALAAARDGGAAFVGFIFYPPSPRYVSPEQAAALAAEKGATRAVAVTVDADDTTLAGIQRAVAIDLWQLHGAESPERVAEVRARFGLPVMKALKVAGPEDLAAAEAYQEAADRLLFDAKPPEGASGMLPGGNALAFDWQLLADRSWPRPWMLSGGLNADNLAEAVAVSGAAAVDVSSGVEHAPGRKDPGRIKTLLELARTLGPLPAPEEQG